MFSLLDNEPSLDAQPVVQFCGNQNFTDVWVDNRFGLCFREIVIGSIPYLLLIPGGIYRAIQISRMKKRTKVQDIRQAGIKKTVLQRRWFWAQFTLCALIAIISQFQLIDAGIFKEKITPVLILSDSLRTLAWGFVAVIIYFEYKKWMAHSAIVRWYYILSFVSSVLKDSSIIVETLETGRRGLFFWSFQVVILLELTLTIMGIVGFFRNIRRKVEPHLPKQFLIELPKEERVNIKAMIGVAAPDALLWLFGIFFAIVQGVATISFLESTSNAVEAIRADQSRDEVLKEMIWFVVFAALAAVSSTASGSLFGVAGMRYVRRLRTRLLDSLMMQEMAFFDTTSPGALIGHLTMDTDKIQAVKDYIPKMLTPGCQVLYGAYTLFKASWQLSLVICALLVVEFIEATARSRQVTHKYSKLYTIGNRGASEKATEVLASFVTTRLFGQEKLESTAYRERAVAAARVGMRKEILEAICEGIEVLLHATVVGLGTLYSFNLIDDGLMEKRDLTEFIVIGMNLIQSFQDVVKTTPNFAEITGPSAIIIGLIKRKPLMDKYQGNEIPDLKGDISFRNVSFTYPNADTPTFTDFNLDVPAGQSIAFVGPSGCGKSSLYKLLLRFYDPQEGCIVIDKKYDLRDLKLKWWLDNIGVVSQEPVLYRGTLRYNILYGVTNPEDYTEEQIMAAVRSAHLEALVQEKGLDFDVGDKGGNLSGEPKILLLDEITSALDALSEAEVMKAVVGLMQGRTTFVIAHRLHTITNVDKICVLKKGRIVDVGRHEELVVKEGFYKEMWDKQQGELAAGVEEAPSSYSLADIDTLLDLLESHDMSNEIRALARRIRPPNTRLAKGGFRRNKSDSDEQIDVGEIDEQEDTDQIMMLRAPKPEPRQQTYILPARRGRSRAHTYAPMRRVINEDDDDERALLLQDKV